MAAFSSAMDVNHIEYTKEISYTENLYAACFEDEFSSEDVPISEERLLQIEAEVSEIIDFNPISEYDVMEILDTTLGAEPHRTDVGSFGEENTLLKAIQDELMEQNSLADLLLMGAEAVQARNQPLLSDIMVKLNTLLVDQEDEDNDPFNRLALFFAQGLHSKIIDAPEVQHRPVSRRPNTLSAIRMIQELSPYIKFAHFTANQAILEAIQGHKEVHIIDFDIMDGIQWPPLMVDLAMRMNESVSLRITAIITSFHMIDDVQRTGKRLKEFAEATNLNFLFDFMVITKEEDFRKIKVRPEHNALVVVNCIIHQLHMPKTSFAFVETFLSGARRLSPKVIVLVEEELFNLAKVSCMSFVEFFYEALHHYMALRDSLASSSYGQHKVCLRLIEQEILGNSIIDGVRQFPSEKLEEKMCKDGDVLKGFKPIQVSSLNVSQAKFLVSLFHGEYWVQPEKYRVSLCWKSRPITTASIWVPM